MKIKLQNAYDSIYAYKPNNNSKNIWETQNNVCVHRGTQINAKKHGHITMYIVYTLSWDNIFLI